jgi:hypothetical protein
MQTIDAQAEEASAAFVRICSGRFVLNHVDHDNPMAH